MQEHRLMVGGEKTIPKEKRKLKEKGTETASFDVDHDAYGEVPLNQIVGLQTTKDVRRDKRATTPLVLPPHLLLEFGTLNMDHSNVFHPTQVRLFLPPISFLTFNIGSSHIHGLPLWPPRFHLGLGPWNMKQFQVHSQSRLVHNILFHFTTLFKQLVLDALTFFLFCADESPIA